MDSDSDDEIQFMGSSLSISSSSSKHKTSPKSNFKKLNSSSSTSGNTKSKSNPNPNHNENQASSSSSSPSSTNSIFSGMDRAQMERDRLKRLESLKKSDLSSIPTSFNPISTSTSTPISNSNNFNSSTSHSTKRQKTGVNTMANLKSDSESELENDEDQEKDPYSTSTSTSSNKNNQVPPPRVTAPSGELLRTLAPSKSAFEGKGNSLGSTSTSGSGSGSTMSLGVNGNFSGGSKKREIKPLPTAPITRPIGGTGPNGVSLEACRRIDPNERFFEGAIKYGFNSHASKAVSGVPFSDFLLPSTPSNSSGLKHALFSTYCADLPWLFPLMPKDVPCTLVARNNGVANLDTRTLENSCYGNWKLEIPKSEELKKESKYQKVMHIKMILLSFESFLRICVLSGNLIEYDWNTIENSALIFDAPKISKGNKAPSSDLQKQLLLTLESLDVPPNHQILNEIKNGIYDMSKAPFKLILSAPTPILNGWDDVYTLGLGRMIQILKEFGLDGTPGVLEAQGSSLGKYSMTWLNNFMAIASGTPRNQLPNLSNKSGGNSQMRLLFPSDRWVKEESVGGVLGAGTFFGKMYEEPINSMLCQPISKRGNLMMHAKSLLFLKSGYKLEELEKNLSPTTSWASGGQSLGGSSSTSSLKIPDLKGKYKARPNSNSNSNSQIVDLTFDDSETEDEEGRKKVKVTPSSSKSKVTSSNNDDDEVVGFSYMGSHNFTQAAWGNLSGSFVKPKLSQGNWELGVIFPFKKSDLKTDNTTSLPRAALNYRRDFKPYRNGDHAWIQPGL